MTTPRTPVPPVLANAYRATRTGPWALAASRRPCLVNARNAICRWLRDAADLSAGEIAGLVGRHRDNVLHHSDMANARRILDPVRCRQVAEHETKAPPDVWLRNEFGSFFRLRHQTIARRRVWAFMRREGLSYPEIAMACGMRTHSTIVQALRHPVDLSEPPTVLATKSGGYRYTPPKRYGY